MNKVKIYGKTLLYVILIILLTTLFFTFLNYINLFGNNLMAVSKVLIPVVALFVGGFIVGKNTCKKGWLEGIKIGVIIIVILMLFKYLGLDNKIIVKDLIYYLILLGSSIFGSMIGINYNKIEEKS